VPTQAPLVVRLVGTNEEEGRAILAGAKMQTAGTLVENGAGLLIDQSLNIGNELLSLNGEGGGNGALHIGGSSVVNYGGAISLVDNTSIKVDAGSTLNLTNALGISGLNKNLTFITDAGATAALSGSLDLGTGDLTKNSSGALILNGDVLSVGLTSIAGGSLQVNSLSAVMHDITGGALIVGDGSTAARLIADSIAVETLTVSAGATLTISSIPGGPVSDPMLPVPEPSTWVLILFASVGALLIGQRRI